MNGESLLDFATQAAGVAIGVIAIAMLIGVLFNEK
jgi:hypothetical protein